METRDADAPCPPEALYRVSVRELCAFAAKAGDLDLRFTPSPTAQDGVLGHREVQARRPAGWRRELPLEWRGRGLLVRGRADAVDAEGGRVEEIKTHRGDAARIPAHHRALHRAQAEAYAWMLCAQDPRDALSVAVVYYDVDTGAETVDERRLDAATLRDRFEALCERFAAWAEAERAHRRARDAALATLRWPFAEFRAGQRTLATAAYNAARSGRPLLAQAPTGIGKTMATLFPLLKALPGSASHAPLDKLFFLAAKTPGRRLGLDALQALRAGQPLPLRVLALTARDKACEHPDKACHGDSCPLARGFYDRLPAARAEAAAALSDDPAQLREVALRHAVCPYYLGQEMARWADVVVGDYHYVFDASALLHALTVENDWRVAAAVDEAHNLVGRAREMYSAELDPQRLAALREALPPALQRRVDTVRRAWLALEDAGDAPLDVHAEVPAALREPIRSLLAKIGERLAEQPELLAGEALQAYFELGNFLALAEVLDAHGQFDLARPTGGTSSARRRQPRSRPCVRNVVPAPFLKPRVEALAALVLFSATLAPADYHLRLLGLPDTTVVLDVESPFEATQLQVHIARDVSTRWSDRDASRTRIADLIAAQWQRQPGNYLAFFSSFDYLECVAQTLAGRHPGIPLRAQRRGMPEAEREAFVASFVPGGAQVGFAVLGGAFGEGIDLPGDRLVGAFVATLGLPQVNPVNEAMRRRMQALFGDGHAFAYLYPGLQKVVQAAGRVIRTPQDRGTLHLIDDRYARPEVRALLPRWWRAEALEA